MREIKFRAWSKVFKRMSPENAEFHFNGGDSHLHFDVFNGNFDTDVWDFSECVLMQYTGLKDKNGVEIYEGDILSGEKGVFVAKIGGYFSEPSVGFGVHYCKDNDESIFVKEPDPFGVESKLKVIGNIYENPELMEIA